MKTKLTIFVFCLMQIFIKINAARAESNDISLEELLSRALAESPLVHTIDAKLQAGISEGIEAKTWKNPSLSSSVLIPVSYPDKREDNEVEVALSQPLKLSNLGLRSTLAELITKASNAEQKKELLEFSQKIRLSYIRLWALQERNTSAAEAEKRASKIHSKVKDSASEGLYSEGEKQLLIASVAKLKAEKRGVEADRDKSLAELIELTNFSLHGRKLGRPFFADLPSDSEIYSALEQNSLPLNERVKLLKDVAEYQFKVAKRDSFPELTPQIIYKHSDDEKEFFGVGLSFELPFSDRNQAERLKREAEFKAAKSQEAFYAGENFREELKLLISSYKASADLAGTYEKEVVPALKKAVSSFEDLLSKGQGSVSQVWQTQSELTEAQSRALELWVKAASERAQLSILLGKDI